MESNIIEQHIVRYKVSPHHAVRDTELLNVLMFPQISLSSGLSLTEKVAILQA